MSNSYKNFFTHLIVVLVLLFDLSLQSIIETSKTQYKLNSNQTIHLIKETRSIGITKISACKVELDNKKIIDLSSLDKESNPRKSPDQFNQYDFEFNPCSPIICETGKPKTAAICQKAKFGNLAYDCGDQSTAYFAYDGTSLTITFTAGVKRSAIVCICGETEAFQFVTEQPVNNYVLKFTSPCCCPDGCKSVDKTCKKTLDDGSVIDLSWLDMPSKPRIASDLYNLYNFEFNPCSPIECESSKSIKSAAICQKSKSGEYSYNIGDQSSEKFSYDGKNFSLNYDHQNAISNVSCICSENESFKFTNEYPKNKYNFEFESPCCCPERCVQNGSCRTYLNGTIVDLSSLDNANNPRKAVDLYDLYIFEFNPCSPIECEPGKNKTAAICQKAKTGEYFYNLGDQSTAKFTTIESNLTITFTSGSMTSRLQCLCGETEFFEFVNEYPLYNYNFKFQSPCCCPGKCKPVIN